MIYYTVEALIFSQSATIVVHREKTINDIKMKKIQNEELVNNLKQVDNWCLKNSIPYKEPKKTHLDDSGKNKATEKNIPVTVSVSGAIVIGSGKEEALKKDSLVKSPPGDLSDHDYQELLKAFVDAPATGCTTVLDMARQSSGYDPLEALSNDNAKKFKDYTNRVLDAPFFHIRGSDSSKYINKTKNWNDVIDFVTGLYEGVSSEDKARITKNIKSLAEVAASAVDTEQQQSLFVQSTLQVDQVLQVYIYSSHITMEEHSHKGAHSTQTVVTIKRVILDFYVDLWPSYAERVMNKHVKKLNVWLDDNTTKKDTSKKVNLTCLK